MIDRKRKTHIDNLGRPFCGAHAIEYHFADKEYATCKNCLNVVRGELPFTPTLVYEKETVHLSKLWGEPKERWLHLKYNKPSQSEFDQKNVPLCGSSGESVMDEKKICLVNCKKCLEQKKYSLYLLKNPKNTTFILDYMVKKYMSYLELIEKRLEVL